MTVLAVAVLLGLAAGIGTGGTLRGLGRLRLRSWPLLAAGIALQAGLAAAPLSWRGAMAGADCALVGLWCCRNARSSSRGQRGASLAIAAGIGGNALAVAANGGMPVSRAALFAAGFSPTLDITKGHLYKHVFMDGGTHLRFLGDFIPLRGFVTVVSPGDLLMLAGAAVLVSTATHLATPRSSVITAAALKRGG